MILSAVVQHNASLLQHIAKFKIKISRNSKIYLEKQDLGEQFHWYKSAQFLGSILLDHHQHST